jgi:hypothetical protein
MTSSEALTIIRAEEFNTAYSFIGKEKDLDNTRNGEAFRNYVTITLP